MVQHNTIDHTGVPGVSSGSVATDTIWNAAGDLAVGTGSDTAARLAIGNAGGALSRVNGAVAWNSGTAFPTAATGDRFWRTDLGLEFYYDGTRWLTKQMFAAHVSGAVNISAINVGNRFGAPVQSAGLDMWLVAADLSVGVFGTNDGSNFWTYTIDKRASNDGATTIFTANTSAVSASTWTRVSTAIGASCALSGAFNFIFQASVKTGSPSNLQATGGFSYRLIGT